MPACRAPLPPHLITSDGVLRGPGVAPEADAPCGRRESQEGRETFRDAAARAATNSGAYSVYSVPSAGSTKPVIVVRPLRLNAYSSRF